LRDNNFSACFLNNAKYNADSSLISTLGDLKLSESDPVCYSAQCRNGSAYQTQTMKDAVNGCPVCLQKMTLTNLTSASDIKQSCNVNTNTNNNTPSPSTSTSTPISTSPKQPIQQYTPPSQQNKTTLTLSDYLDRLSTFLNDILDSISNLFNN
jgi:hypothetical protein